MYPFNRGADRNHRRPDEAQQAPATRAGSGHTESTHIHVAAGLTTVDNLMALRDLLNTTLQIEEASYAGRYGWKHKQTLAGLPMKAQFTPRFIRTAGSIRRWQNVATRLF